MARSFLGKGWRYPVMIDRNGNVRYLLFSAITTQDVEALFNKLQQEPSALR